MLDGGYVALAFAYAAVSVMAGFTAMALPWMLESQRLGGECRPALGAPNVALSLATVDRRAVR